MKIIHKQDCKRIFSRYDLTCPRCQELQNGASPREGWGDVARQQAKSRSLEISAHYANHSNCDYERQGVPCVKFDW